jgi:uncharacterized protein
MSISVYNQVIAPLSRMLSNLDAVISKAEQYAAEHKIEPETLIQARLFPNMLPLVFQIRIATDTAKGAAARLSGSPVPKWADDEETFADVHGRIRKAIDFLATFKPAQFEGSEKRNIELKLGTREVKFSGTDYITGFVIPNFYFHVTTAYAILRHNGVDVGKRDYLGDTG